MKITKIEPKKTVLPKRKRVAAYARVSMESERLAHSLSAQISYYSELIQKNPKWEYAGVYADSFISGTDTTKRQEFQRMVADCEKGLIDIILCKSISRFARNTVDLLETVRHLKDLGIEVQFEKENINSLSGDGELMLTILASFAQEESRSISDNIKWGFRKRFENGTAKVKCAPFGYKKIGSELIIVPEEAEIVKQIFHEFINGKQRCEIRDELNATGITSQKGNKWKSISITKILTNITYTGNMLFQKEFITDPISKKHKINRGELPKYLIEETHTAIVSMEEFQIVQNMIAKREFLNTCSFTGKIKCPYHNHKYIRMRKPKFQEDNWRCSAKKCDDCILTRGIDHQKLIEATEKVLGSFDEDIVFNKIDCIFIPKDDTIEFHLKDGTVTTETYIKERRRCLK